MAADFHSQEIPQKTVTPPSTPMPSMPLQLSGFLSGDTIQVEGDTGNLHFSVKFNVHNKCLSKNDSNFHFPSLNSLENDVSCQKSSFSSYVTPKSTQEIENRIVDSEPSMVENHGIETERTAKHDTTKRMAIMTRLRSGVISQVKYFPRISRKECRDLRSCMSMTMKRKRKKRETEDIVLEKLLQKRSCPVRPCSSYIFFVMASWGSVKCSSFGETSKRLSQMWCKLPHKDKKIYEDIALKDSARYRRQCMLLNCQVPDPSPHQNSSIDAHSAN
ncbi:High mobility group box domain - like 5 [Theobroma cacao]|nr:High mobility group box domain - like 5 [Theobroma cacao]